MPFGETTQTIQATEQTVYSVTVYNKYDCEASVQMEIKPDCVSKSFIPTAFSPNGDGLNDVFRPTLINFEDYKLQVYNRWGELLYESKDVKAGWDGTFRGNPVQDGVYTYIMRYKTTEDMQWQNVGGVLTILR
jgi:gliding motility-associated-like protein